MLTPKGLIPLFVILSVLSILAAPPAGLGAEVTLAWDEAAPTPDGYNLYQRKGDEDYDFSTPVWSGTEPTCTISDLSEGTLYYFVVRPYVGSEEDGDSNEVSYQSPLVTTTSYAITASAGSNGTISPSGTNSVTAGGTQNYTISADTGYHVADVLVDGASVGMVTSYTFSDVSADHTISVAFEADSFTITASAGSNGTISPSGATSVAYGGSQIYTISPGTGCHVSNVLVDGVSVGAVIRYAFSNVTANHTISATFAADSYTITASAGSNGSISPSGATSVAYGGSQTYTISPGTGYNVSDVVVDDVSVGAVSSYTFSNVDADHTISAAFTAGNYIITASAGSNGTISPSGSTSVVNGGSQTYTISPGTGYNVSSVLVDGVSVGAVNSYTFSNVSASHTISATFAINSYTITASAGSNGTISPSGSTSVTYGGSQTYAISAGTGYNVSNVLVDGVSVGAVTRYTFSLVSANHTISASFGLSNQTPVAEAGNDQTVDPETEITLDGSGSYDPDGSLLTYSWSQSEGPTMTLSDPNIATPTFTAPAGSTEAVTLTFKLTVSDPEGLNSSDTCQIQVKAVTVVNEPPVAEAGTNQTVTAGSNVKLNGSDSFDPEGSALAYLWNQSSGTTVQLSATDILNPSFIAPQINAGQTELLVFELTVTDDQGNTGSDTCVVQVNAALPVDTDGDGISDTEDAFPTDASESVDTDQDGIGNNSDLDDDNDGMPDSWETLYGLNPLVDDSEGDADGDGICNLAEYQSGSDPTLSNQNQPPATPEILYPADNETSVSTRPVLKASDFSDPDTSDSHEKSEWLIMMESDQSIVFQTVRGHWFLTTLRVPRLILKAGTTYTCQVRYYDDHDQASQWSSPTTFTTKSSRYTWFEADANTSTLAAVGTVALSTDFNANNIPDSEEPQSIQILQSQDGETLIGIGIEDGTGSTLDGALIIDPITETLETDTQDLSVYDLFTYRIVVDDAGGTCSVARYRSNGIGPQDDWICNGEDGMWADCSSENSPDDAASEVVRIVQDGGPEDVDGVANGIIVAITGVGMSTDTQETANQSLENTDDNTNPLSPENMGCFIGSLLWGSK